MKDVMDYIIWLLVFAVVIFITELFGADPGYIAIGMIIGQEVDRYFNGRK